MLSLPFKIKREHVYCVESSEAASLKGGGSELTRVRYVLCKDLQEAEHQALALPCRSSQPHTLR